MENKICSIICGAPCKLKKELVEGFVIAADSGLDRCLEFGNGIGITPDLVVGDFDSAKTEVPSGIEIVTVPSEKDDTDAHLAAQIALERGFTEIRLFCALGGRASHSIANIQLLRELKKKQVRAALFGESSMMFLICNESVELPKFSGYLSLFAMDETALVSEVGVKYPLTLHTLTNDFPLGVSNEITEKTAVITSHEGLCLIVLEEE
ncbi:MAG: thiamine diphosphokinase [Oscillospiraceae bacterium]|nr:thiamine diphosphokinase [Oscillospiraceae bacterium]